ncbi:MAG: MATE family efflux transporter [Treponema sp.]
MSTLPGFYSTLFTIAVPIILQNLLQTFVNMLDTIMVGQLGSAQIAAVGLGNQVFFMLNMILFGISSGGSIFVAQFWGKKDISGIRRTLGITLSLSFAVSVVFAAGALFFPRALIGLYSHDPLVIELGAQYLRLVGISYPLMAVSFAYQLAFRATEHVKLPMVSTAVSFGVNAFGNWILIFGMHADVFGLHFVIPAYGVKGAAVATVFSRIVELVITLGWAYHKKFEAAGSVRELLSFDRGFLARFIRIALPVIINESVWGFGITAQNSIFAHAGTNAIAAFNITGTISQLTWVFFIGVGNGAGIIIGKKIGEGDENMARRYAARFAWFMPLMAVGLGTLLYPLSLLLPHIFNVEPEIIRQAQYMLRILMCLYPANAFNMCFIVGICRSGGDTVYAGFNDIFWMWAVAIPLGCFAAFVLHWDPFMIYACLQTEQLLKMSAGLLRLKSGRWLHNVTE